MRQPADVLECLANQAAGLGHKPPVKRSSDRSDPCKNEAFRRLGREKRITITAGKVADEKSGCLSPDRRLPRERASLSNPRSGRGEEPITSQAPARRGHGFVAFQVWCGQRANPRNGFV